MTAPANSTVQNILPVQALFDLENNFQTFIGQGQPFYATINPNVSNVSITNSTIDSTTIGATTPSTGVFTNIQTTTGQISTNPTSNTDIANKYYVDMVAAGLNPKQSVQCATTANITLSGLQTIDTYSVQSGDRVLVKNQTNTPDNGIYIAASGAWTRSTDMDVWSEVPGAYTVVLYGSANSQTGWVSTSAATGTIGTTAITFVQFSGSATYFAGTGLTLASNTFSITNTGVTAGNYGSSSNAVSFAVNAQGQITSAANSAISINANQITSGTIASSLISGNYANITGVGTISSGTWQGNAVSSTYGGTGLTNPTGYVYFNGAGAASNSTTIPTTSLSGTITNSQLQNNTISGVMLGGNLFNLTAGTNINFSSGTTYNGSSAITINANSTMVYPGAGIPNSTGSAWGTSYGTTGSGNVVLATSATIATPTFSTTTQYTPYSSTPSQSTGLVWYDNNNDTLAFYNSAGEQQINRQLILKTYNQTGNTIASGSVVYINGTYIGQYPTIGLAQANLLSTSTIIGVTTQSISNGGSGYVVIGGLASGINTAAYSAGVNLFLSPTTPGALTSTMPNNPNYAIQVGVVITSSSSGSMVVSPAYVTSPANAVVGILSISQGGTNGNATPTAGGVAYGNGTSYAFTSVGSTGQVLTSSGSGAPTWTTPAAAVTVSDNTSTNATFYPLFANVTSGTVSTEFTSSTKYQYNPSTGTLTSPSFVATSNVAANVTTGAFSYGALTYPDVNIVASYANSVNNYVQVVIQNTSTGTQASADFIVSNNNSNATTVYGDFGINSSNFAGTGSLSLPSATYLYATGGDLVLGTQSNNSIHLVVGNSATDAMQINTSGAVAFNGSYGTSGQVLTSAGSSAVPTWSTPTGNATYVSITDNTSSNATYYPTFVSATTGNAAIDTSSTKLQYNPSTGTLSAPVVSGNLVTATNGIVVNSKTVSANYTIPSGSSAMSAGPISISANVTVTISSGSRWVVL